MEAEMVLPSTLFCLLVSLVSGNLLTDDQKRPMKGEPEEGKRAQTRIKSRQHRSVGSQEECQEGDPLGVSYSGRMNVTASGRTCQVWAAQQPHEHDKADVGEHNHCRNPDGYSLGVWCYTTDPDKRWEACSVPHCDPTYICQDGNPLGLSYVGIMNTTVSGRTCKVWAETQFAFFR